MQIAYIDSKMHACYVHYFATKLGKPELLWYLKIAFVFVIFLCVFGFSYIIFKGIFVRLREETPRDRFWALFKGGKKGSKEAQLVHCSPVVFCTGW